VSIHTVARKHGAAYEVRYRDGAGRQRSRAFGSEADAQRYQQAIDAARRKARSHTLKADLESRF
jgi:hypothetical protein